MPPRAEPRWLTTAMVVALQQESIRRFGGRPGIRDQGLLESAMARPRNRYTYTTGDVEQVQLAAAYGFGLARNHAFIDGNKRICVLAVAVFLSLNGVRFDPEQADEVRTVLALAAGDLSEQQLADWIAGNLR